MSPFSLENQWVFIAANMVIWVVICSVIELVFFNGDLLETIISAVAGGLGSGFVLFNYRPDTGK